MEKIHSIVDALVGLRKLFFSIGAIGFIGVGLTVILVVFTVDWYLGTSVLSGDNLATIVVAGFQYVAAVATAYLAVNVANKWVTKWMEKRK